jgi:DNA polymerase
MATIPSLPLEERDKKLQQIRDEVLALTSLPLYAYRTENKYFPVLGEGSHMARIVFVGEAPGRNEAETGRPFCGAAGKILDALFASAGLKRSDTYITNIVKDRPPGNRDPLPEEIAAYAPFLDRQLAILQPALLVTLGRFSMAYIMEKFGLADKLQPISLLHGQLLEAETPWGKISILPLYHPAATIYNRQTKEALMQDFQIIKKFI